MKNVLPVLLVFSILSACTPENKQEETLHRNYILHKEIMARGELLFHLR